MPDSSIDVGRRLRELRTERGLSLRALAQASGVSVTAISQIEKNRVSPSVSTLQQLATALGVPVIAFFQRQPEPRRVVYIQATDRTRIELPGGTLERLAADMPGLCMEPMLLQLEPGADSGPDSIVHLGHEFVFCLSGAFEYEIDGTTYPLGPGDSLLFEADLPHYWRNPGDEPATALIVLHAPSGRGRPMRRHFRRMGFRGKW